MKPTKLSGLIEALEFDSDERVTRVDLQDGCVVTVELSLLSALDEGDDETPPDLPDWQQPEWETARAIAADSGERFVPTPDRFDLIGSGYAVDSCISRKPRKFVHGNRGNARLQERHA